MNEHDDDLDSEIEEAAIETEIFDDDPDDAQDSGRLEDKEEPIAGDDESEL